MNTKGIISNIIRKLGLTSLVDLARFWLQSYKNKKSNEAFVKANPEILLPPDYLMYESFRINYERYYSGGKETASWLAGLILKHLDVNRGDEMAILDWGCGPGRIIRHLSEYLPVKVRLYGTDYNSQSIEWCRNSLKNISFSENSLEAELPYGNDAFEAIYGISIFTHLSEKMHREWISELTRVMKPGGLLILTMQGDNFKEKLSPVELDNFEKGNLVVRGSVKEGHRTYSAFHPDKFLRELFNNLDVVEKIVTQKTNSDYTPQDTWILKKVHASYSSTDVSS